MSLEIFNSKKWVHGKKSLPSKWSTEGILGKDLVEPFFVLLDRQQPRRRLSGEEIGECVELHDLRRQQMLPNSGDKVNNEMDHLRLSRKPGKERCRDLYRQMVLENGGHEHAAIR